MSGEKRIFDGEGGEAGNVAEKIAEILIQGDSEGREKGS